jgi:hypothetical protein
MSIYPKAPNEVLDYTIDWSDFLAEGEAISASTFTAASGITKDSQSNSNNAATVWLSGGTHGQEYVVKNTITTSASRTAERSIKIICRNR